MWISRFKTMYGIRTLTTITIRQSKPIQHAAVRTEFNSIKSTPSISVEETPFQSFKTWTLPSTNIPALVRPLKFETLPKPHSWTGDIKNNLSYFGRQMRELYGNSVGPQSILMFGRFDEHATTAAMILDPLYIESPNHSKSRIYVICSWVVYRRLSEMIKETGSTVREAPIRGKWQATDRSRLLGIVRVFFQFIWYQTRDTHGVNESVEESRLRIWQEIELLESSFETMRATNQSSAMHAAIWTFIYPTYPTLDRCYLDACVDFIQHLRSDASTWTMEQVYRGKFQLTPLQPFTSDFTQPLRWDTDGIDMTKALLQSLKTTTPLSKRPIT